MARSAREWVRTDAPGRGPVRARDPKLACGDALRRRPRVRRLEERVHPTLQIRVAPARVTHRSRHESQARDEELGQRRAADEGCRCPCRVASHGLSVARLRGAWLLRPPGALFTGGCHLGLPFTPTVRDARCAPPGAPEVPPAPTCLTVTSTSRRSRTETTCVDPVNSTHTVLCRSVHEAPRSPVRHHQKADRWIQGQAGDRHPSSTRPGTTSWSDAVQIDLLRLLTPPV